MGFLIAIVIAVVVWRVIDANRIHKASTKNFKQSDTKTFAEVKLITYSNRNVPFTQVVIDPRKLPDVTNSAIQFTGAANKLNCFAESLDREVTLYRDVQKATSHLCNTIAFERTVIEYALQAANSKIQEAKFRKKLSPDMQQNYDKNKLRIGNFIEESRGKQTKEKPSYSRPDFELPPRHSDEAVANAIEAKIKQIELARNVYIEGVNKQLSRNELGLYFIPEFKRLAGPEASKSLKDGNSNIFVPVNAGNVAHQRIDRQAEADKQKAPIINDPLLLRQFSLEMRATTIRIPYLVHFTRSENLHSIMQIGLCPIATLNTRGVGCRTNDRLRLDGHRDAVCLSIAHPNDKMFAKYRWATRDENWVVLVLHGSIIWETNSAFCRHNAADSRTSKQSLFSLKTVSAFDSMFLPSDDLPSRDDNNLMTFDPTDVQAEVLVFDVLQPRLIKAVVFSNTQCLERYRDALEQQRLSINVDGQGFFGARSHARKVGWTY